jgi:hypothetical protein
VTLLAQFQIATHATNLRISEIADQLPNRTWSNLRTNVNENNDVCRSFRHSSVDRNRLTSVFLEDKSIEARVLLARQQFCRTVVRAVRNDNDLLDVVVVEAKQVLDLTGE